MPSILLVVFLLQLTIYIINTIGAPAINDFLWQIFNKTPLSSTSPQVTKATALRKEQIKLQRELNATSAQDDFAKWAKIRRNLDKATADHDKISQSVQSSRASFDSKANTLRFVLTTGARMGIGFAYTKQPMFWLPKGWVPHYVEWILSFPKAPIGAVSIQVWLAACGAVINLVGKALAAAGVLALGSVQQAKLEKAKAKVQAEKTKEKKEL